MRTEDALLYLCCAQNLSAQKVQRIKTCARASHLDWQKIFDLAHAHAVAPLVFHNLELALSPPFPIPPGVTEQFKLAIYRNIIAKQRQKQNLLSALAHLGANGVDAMAVKGAALDLLVYDEPWYTVSLDVDLVLRPQGEQRVDALHPSIVAGIRDMGIEYELYEHHDVSLNGALTTDFSRIWRDATRIDYCGRPLYLMSPEDMLLAVCVNSCRKRYFRLRSLCDISETVRRFPQLDWDKFSELALAYQCNNIAYTALSVTQATVGCSLPDGLLTHGLRLGRVRRRVIDRLLRYLLDHVPLTSLSYYTGREVVIRRRIGWSLALLYATYNWRQMASKLREALLSRSLDEPAV